MSFSPKVEDASCIRLGIRPSLPEIERRLIRQFDKSAQQMEYEEALDAVVGQDFYVVSAKWWKSYCKKIQYFRDDFTEGLNFSN